MTTTKPQKPTPDFPLYPHASGQWCKTIKGRKRYFGVWAEPSEALQRYNEFIGKHEPQEDADEGTVCTVDYLCNEFLGAQMKRVKRNELRNSTWLAYKQSCELIIESLKRDTPLEDLKPMHFDKLRMSLPSTWKPPTVASAILRMKVVFSYAHKTGLVSHPFSYGLLFNRPSSSVMRRHRTSSPEKFWEASDIHKLLHHSDTNMQAFILLGVNCAFLPCDCARLRFDHIDGQWNNYNREKTGNYRKSWMWKETVDAINAAIECRPKTNDHKETVFLTRFKNPWINESTSFNAITCAFTSVRESAKLNDKGISFSALRSTFRTVADSVDKDAARYVCGHSAEGNAERIDEVYRSFKRFSAERFVRVSDHVHDWLFG